MKDLDKKIKEALARDEKETAAAMMTNPTVFDELKASFRTKNRFFVMVVWAYLIIFTILLVVTGKNFFTATEPISVMRWGVGFLFSGIVILYLKNWYAMEMNKNSVMREVKRLELQVARLEASSRK